MNKERIDLSPPHLSGNEWKYVKEALDSNWVAPLGPQVDLFEKETTSYIKTNGAIAMSSGTAAIHIALVLLDVSPGDTVICSSLTFVASANPILYQRATPVFIDSEPETWNMSPIALENALKESSKKNKLPKAVIVVDLFGQSANYDKITKICKEYDVPIIEDSAESLGATYNGKKCGSFGDFGILSFNGNKIITTSGGGMLLAKNTKYIEKAKFLITQARDPARHYQHSELGYNYRMSNILAAIGRAQLENIEVRVQQKRAVFDQFSQALKSYDFIEFMPEPVGYKSNRWLTSFVINNLISNLETSSFYNYFQEENIDVRPIWKPLHLQPLFKDCLFYKHDTYRDYNSVSEYLFEKGICLPSGSSLEKNQIDYIITSIKKLI